MSKSKHKGQKVRVGPNGPRNKMAAAWPEAFVDVILPIYGEWALAEKAIDCLPQAFQGCQESYRLIVVDNGTPEWKNTEGQTVSAKDQAIAVRSRLRPQDAFYRLDENKGYPGGMNFAARHGASPLILLLTADVLLWPGAAARLIREMDNPTTGVCGPMLIFPNGSPHGPAERVQHAGVAFDIRGKPFHIFIGWTPENPKVAKRRDMAAVTGACFITRRNIWQQIGGMFEGYGKGTYEDMEYCFACRAGGANVIFLPEAKGYHVVGGSIAAGTQQGGFTLPLNETIFKGRWAGMLAWDEWRYW